MTIIQGKQNQATVTIHGQSYLHNKTIRGGLWNLVQALQRVLPEGRTAELCWFSGRQRRGPRNDIHNSITVLKHDGKLCPLRGHVNGELLPDLEADEVVEYYEDQAAA